VAENKTAKEEVVLVFTKLHCGENVLSCFIYSKLKQWLLTTVCSSDLKGSATSSQGISKNISVITTLPFIV
jgi:hypothetical protein